jgi:hypothetical protein
MYGYEDYEIDENFLNAITEIEDQYYASKAIGVNPIHFVQVPVAVQPTKLELATLAPVTTMRKRRTRKSRNPRKSLDLARRAAMLTITEYAMKRAEEITERPSDHKYACAESGNATTLEHYTAAGDSLL